MKVCVVTSTSPYRKAMFDLTYPNMMEYANRHNYDTHVINLEDGVWAYKKHEAFRELFNSGHDVIFYKDDDSLFTNMTTHVESFIDFKHGFYITRDVGGFNGGVMLLVKDGGSSINDLVLNNSQMYYNEQDLLNALYPSIKEMISVLPQQYMNSYLYESYPEIGKRKHEEGQWEYGDFILHLPALTIEKRIEILKNTSILK